VLGQRLLDLFDRLLAEVRNRGQLVLRLRHEVADRLDADPLEAVVRANAELELLDREVLHSVGQRDVGRATLERRCLGAEALDAVEVGEDRQLPDQDLSPLRDRILRIDRAVGRDVQDQLVVVGALAHPCRFDVVRDAADRREHRVDWNDADRVGLAAVPLGGNVAATATDRERDLEPAFRAEVRDLELRIQDLEVGGSLDVGAGDAAPSLCRQPNFHLGRFPVEDADQLLQIEDYVGDVLANTRERRELVRDALDLDRGHGGALERREQHAAQRVAERVAEAAVERLDHEDATMLLDFLVGDLRDLEIHYRRACSHLFLSSVLRELAERYLE
jgi:hypothetical protein